MSWLFSWGIVDFPVGTTEYFIRVRKTILSFIRVLPDSDNESKYILQIERF